MVQRSNPLRPQIGNVSIGKPSRSMPSKIAITPDRLEVSATQLGQRASDPNSTDIRGLRIQRADRPQLAPARLVERLAVIEWAIVVIAAVIAKLLYLDSYLGGAQSTLLLASLGLILGFVLLLIYCELGLYEPRVMADSSIEFGKLIGGLMLSFLVLTGFLYLLKIGETFSRGWMLLWFGVSASMLCLARGTMRSYVKYLIAEGGIRERIGLVGADDSVRQLKQSLETCSEVEVARVYDDRYCSRGSLPTSTVKGGLEGLVADARKGAFDQIIIAIPASEKQRIANVVERLAVLPLDLHLFEGFSGLGVPIYGSRRFGNVLMHLVRPKPPSNRAQLIKTVLDYLIAAGALAMLLPVFAVIALAIKADSHGPMFFRQRRYGRNQEVFYIFKFRTMTVLEDGLSIKQAERNDNRTTRVGRILRRSSLDELPQLLNVLRGQMSIVGPRPHALIHDEFYAAELSRYSWRHRVKPGITGWAQVHGFRGEIKNCEAMRKRMEHDLYYIDNWSIWLDLEILLLTPFAVFTAHGAY